MRRVVSRWLPPLALMGLIFFLSDQERLSTGLGTWDTILRKGAHMVEYGVLALLLWRALQTRSAWPAAALAVLYAVSDELHQSYVPTRHGSPLDVAIDAVGVVAAVVLWRWWRARGR